ncbi:MAG: helix-turn-helix domain-containing protein [Bacteroidetes bacterium]|nr:helix-turn-helix domain-containing protein [Bacteroidota bacterium]
MNQFGEQIRLLREQCGLLQRQVASQVEMDIPMLSKIERGERNAKREQVTTFSKIFNFPEDELLSLWLADKVFEVIKNEDVALKALSVTENELRKMKMLSENSH